MTTGYVLKIENLTEVEIKAKLCQRPFGPYGWKVSGTVGSTANNSFADSANYMPGVGLIVWFHGPGSNSPRVWREFYKEVKNIFGDVRLSLKEKTRFGYIGDRIRVEESDPVSGLVRMVQAE